MVCKLHISIKIAILIEIIEKSTSTFQLGNIPTRCHCTGSVCLEGAEEVIKDPVMWPYSFYIVFYYQGLLMSTFSDQQLDHHQTF